MAVNLIDSNDIQIAQTGNNIELQIDSDIKSSITQNTSDIAAAQQDITNLENGNVYSTNEVNTGKIWIDNKPIYRKVVANGSNATNGTKFSLDSINNLYEVVDIKFKAIRINTGAQIFDNYYDSSTNKFSLQYYNSSNLINVWAGSESYTVYIMVEYTKTTD